MRSGVARKALANAVVVALCDLDGRVLEVRKHAGDWPPEDEMRRLSRLDLFWQSTPSSYPGELGRIQTNRMDVGGCTNRRGSAEGCASPR